MFSLRGLFCAVLAMLLWSCGQQGPLYLPADAPAETVGDETADKRPKKRSRRLF